MMIEYAEGDLTPEEEAEKLSELLDEIEALRVHLEDADESVTFEEDADPDTFAEEALGQIDELEERLKAFYSVHKNYEYSFEYLQEVREYTTAHDFGEAAFIAKKDLEKRLGLYRRWLLQSEQNQRGRHGILLD